MSDTHRSALTLQESKPCSYKQGLMYGRKAWHTSLYAVKSQITIEETTDLHLAGAGMDYNI